MCYPGMPEVCDDEDHLPHVYTSAEVTCVDDVGKYKKVHKQITIIDLMKPILKNTEEHPMSLNMGQAVIIDMECDAEALKNELEKNDPPLHFRTKPWRLLIHLCTYDR